MFHERWEVLDEEPGLLLPILRVRNRQGRGPDGLGMIRIFEEQRDREVQFLDDVRVLVQEDVEAFPERSASVISRVDRPEHMRELFRRRSDSGAFSSFPLALDFEVALLGSATRLSRLTMTNADVVSRT